MATVSGSYVESNVVTVAALIVLIKAHYAVQEARITALGAASTRITGNITVKMYCDDGAAGYFTHRISHSINCSDAADLESTMTALGTFMSALELHSDYTNVLECGVSTQTNFSN